MDKLYSCTKQGRTLLFTIIMLLLAPLSMVTLGQSPCSSPVTRLATNGKSTNSNIYDDIAIAMTNLLGEGSEAAWVLESGATFTENTDGTARLQGTVKQFGDYPTPRRMALDILLGGKSYSPDAAGPYNQTGVPTSSWYYYYTLSGTMTGLDALAGGQLSLAIHMHPFQVGIGANQLFNAEDQVANGAGGWFEWTVVSQPTDNALQFTNYIPGFTISDFALLLSGTPATPCEPNPCANILSVRKVLNTATNCGVGTPYAMYFSGNYYTAGNDLTFTEYTNGTAVLKGTVLRNGQTFAVNVTYSGKTTTAPANSPKLELCATSANTNNGNGWIYYTEMTGTVETEMGVCNVLRRGPSFQMGMFGNLQENKLGASGWFSCSNNAEVGDFNFNIGEVVACGTTSGSIGDQLYCDINNNGVFDAGDLAVTGLTVTLCDANFVTITTQAVDASGKYLFANLPAGVYNVKFPETTLDGKPQRQLGPINVNLSAGQNFLDADKGYYLAPVDPCANDTQAPVFTNCPLSVMKDVTGMTGACWSINWTVPTATDNCSTPVVTSNYNSGYCFPVGLTTITYTATDAHGNKSTCVFTVNINKSTSCNVSGNTISKTCVNNIPVIIGTTLNNHEYMWLKSTTGCPTQSSQAIAGATGQTYNLPSRVTVTTYFIRCARPIGCTTWGPVNESNCITVTPSDCDPCISDVTPPSITCVAPINKDVTGMTGTCWAITYAMPTATDNCSTPTIIRESGPASGSCLAVGSYDVVFKATDVKGNIARCTLKINITKNDPCAGISSIRSVKNTYDYCGATRQPYVAVFNGTYYTAGSDLKYTEYTNGTALLKGTIYTGGVAYWINMTFSGKTTVSSGSPKIMLCATGKTTGAGWYYYTTTGGQINTPTGTYSLTRQGPAFQVGQFANLQENTYGASGWFYGNGTVGGDVNMNLGPVEACGSTNTCTGIGATVYTDCSYGGTAKSLSVGTYTLAQLNAIGIPNDVISSIKVNAGYKVTLYCDDNFSGQQLVKTADDDCLVNDYFNDLVSSIKVECGSTPVVSCTVTGNTISKSCVNNLPVVTGTALTNYEYVWLKSTTGCPTQSSQAIAGATGQNYNLPSRVTVTTYFVRCARPIGCTTWGTVNESNCVVVSPTDCAPTATCSINFSSTKSYRIVSKVSGKALDVYGSGTYNDCPIVQWNYNGTANQQWRLFSLGGGYFKVMARNSGKYLACHYTSNSTPVYQYDYYTGGYKDWKIECVGTTGYYRLIHRASGKCLDVPGSSTADGAKMQIYPWNGTDAQLFKIEEVPAAPAAYSASSTVLAMNATAESDRVRLGWLSNTGYDNDFYTVEKMNPSTGDFEKMSLVNNTQFDDQVQTHVVYDLNPTEGDNFYRVKVTMNDGFEKLTEVKKVSFKRMVGFGAFPNPATDELNVNLSEYMGKSVDIVIYNSLGKAMTRQHVDNLANPIHQFDVNDYAPGQYLIRVSAEGKRDATQQVVIQK